MMSSGIFLPSLSSVFLGVALLSPLVIGVTSNNILFTSWNTRRKKESFSSSSIKIRRDGSLWSVYITHTLPWPGKLAHVIDSISTYEESPFLKERDARRQGQPHGFNLLLIISS